MHTSYGHTLGVLSILFGSKANLVLSRRVDNPLRDNWFTKWKYNHPRIKKIIPVSHAIRKVLEKKLKNQSKLVTIHSGIDFTKFTDITHGNFLRTEFNIDDKVILIGNTSALSDHKDYPTFIKTARYLVDKGINAKFLIIGSGELKDLIEDKIREEKMEEHVIMTGFLTNLPLILPELDIFLMTSKTEGLGTSILDAFACEVPVVATDAGGIPEMVIHESTGLLSPVRDYLDLGENILRLVNEIDLKDRLIKNAKKFLRENFSIKKTAAETLNVYEEIIYNGK
jgi:glycosyltransferase involved in cell wall biosynthesis